MEKAALPARSTWRDDTKALSMAASVKRKKNLPL
eukprot:CAMPEP_0115575626 /NCGR_PEP_ID=MMETSP0272-20121206/2137_1 /TAXON_ID=71861 /ORGANISM="Scrippsiella trochoidea, Strain CCMP3099" /LENGTH=33 /DNA_ID= /DNA_START= /DNA_END= /DNA_ORIENTATION=